MSETHKSPPRRQGSKPVSRMSKRPVSACGGSHRALIDGVRCEQCPGNRGPYRREHDVLTLSGRDRRFFVEALLKPNPPNKSLRQAAKRYKSITGI